MADYSLIDGDDLNLQIYLVTAEGSPLSGVSVTLKFVKKPDNTEYFYDGEGWTSVASIVDYEESDNVPGLYRYTIPHTALAIGNYTAISTATDRGAVLESVIVSSRKSTRNVTVG